VPEPQASKRLPAIHLSNYKCAIKFSILQIDREAAELMCEKLQSLKAFLQDIDMLRR
jgi:hypothetical protein